MRLCRLTSSGGDKSESLHDDATWLAVKTPATLGGFCCAALAVLKPLCGCSTWRTEETASMVSGELCLRVRSILCALW